MKIIRIILLILIIIGLGLLATQRYWVSPLVNKILSYEKMPVVVSPTPAPTHLPAPTGTATVPVSHPPTPPVNQASSSVAITATIGPTCPVMKDPPDPACADKPYETTLVLASTIIGRNGGVLVKTDAQGYFSESISPGIYTIRAQSDAALPRLTPVTFTVEPNKQTSVHLQFDSGIR
ncbi:MAG: hypothetical protein JWM39_687 [Parcubacteria group bacterium]|nr:hypothetical protein [Parcubacteria group bacterium]